MASASLIFEHFPDLTAQQKEQIEQLEPLYQEWNAQINVISRKDMDRFYERHVLHSLGIAKVIDFKPGTKVLDIGTGGGFPGIPLAILFPETNFHLVDSVGKKIKVVKAVTESLALKNVRSEHARAEQLKQQYDFIVSRAVTALPKFLPWTRGKIKKKEINDLPNGLIYLKGGDFHEELNSLKLKQKPTLFDLSACFDGEFFDTKKVVVIPLA